MNSRRSRSRRPHSNSKTAQALETGWSSRGTWSTASSGRCIAETAVAVAARPAIGNSGRLIAYRAVLAVSGTFDETKTPAQAEHLIRHTTSAPRSIVANDGTSRAGMVL